MEKLISFNVKEQMVKLAGACFWYWNSFHLFLDLQEVYDTERHLLYVACTRARDHLLVTSVAPASEFLDDLRA